MENHEDKRLVAGINPALQLLNSANPVDRLYIASGKDTPQIRHLISLAKSRGIPVVVANTASLSRMCDSVQHQGVVAMCAEKEYVGVEDLLEYAQSKNEKPFLVILDGITDPHNFGAIIRTAEGAGVHGIIVAKRSAAPLSQVVSKTSAGAIETMRIARVSNLASTIDALKAKGLWIFGTADASKTCYDKADFNCPCAVVIGDEGTGIGRLVGEKCDFLLKIPMLGSVSSLNASVAAGVILYEAVRQRNIQLREE